MAELCHGGHIGGDGKVQIFIRGRDLADTDLYELCQAQATCVVVAGCVHEHMQRAPACEACATAAVAQVGDGMKPLCHPCMQRDCLDCTVFVSVERPLAAAS